MKKMIITAATVYVAGSVMAGLYGDTPDAKHAWSVHDANRPNPVKVSAAKIIGQPPSDAIVLFDGTKESLKENWCDEKGGPAKWYYDECERSFGLKKQCEKGKWSTGAGPIFTKGEYGDCQLHVEFKFPLDITGSGQMRGNSGIFLMGLYEIQVLESFCTDPADMTNPNYADGQCGSVYAEAPPLVNANRCPGEWQCFDIVFHQPIWAGNELVHQGSVTVFLNGVLVQDHWEMEGLTTHCYRRKLGPHSATRQFYLQDHGCPLSFRNIWLRPLHSRWANTTHSVMAGKESDVMGLRRKTAAELYEKIGDKKAANEKTVCALAEVISYANEEPYLSVFNEVLERFRLNVNDTNAINVVNKSLDVLIRNNVISADMRIALK